MSGQVLPVLATQSEAEGPLFEFNRHNLPLYALTGCGDLLWSSSWTINSILKSADVFWKLSERGSHVFLVLIHGGLDVSELSSLVQAQEHRDRCADQT